MGSVKSGTRSEWPGDWRHAPRRMERVLARRTKGASELAGWLTRVVESASGSLHPADIAQAIRHFGGMHCDQAMVEAQVEKLSRRRSPPIKLQGKKRHRIQRVRPGRRTYARPRRGRALVPGGLVEGVNSFRFASCSRRSTGSGSPRPTMPSPSLRTSSADASGRSRRRP